MTLHTTDFPSKAAQKAWEGLLGLDEHKLALVDTLELLMAPDRLLAWKSSFHPAGLRLAEVLDRASPLVVLGGDVGCGKTALATGVGHQLATRLDKRVRLIEPPAAIRGTGLVGEMSSNIGELFRVAVTKVPRGGYGLLLLDEGDDLATSREQLQAHHEDRAGVNALIKAIDGLGAGVRLAVILCTNRPDALDPAIVRRAALSLRFGRPRGEALESIVRGIFEGVLPRSQGLREFIKRLPTDPPYTPSDLLHRVGRRALLAAFREERAVTVEDLLAVIEVVEPTPEFGRSANGDA